MILKREEIINIVSTYMDEEFKKEDNELVFRIAFKQKGIDFDILKECLKELKAIEESC